MPGLEELLLGRDRLRHLVVVDPLRLIVVPDVAVPGDDQPPQVDNLLDLQSAMDGIDEPVTARPVPRTPP